MDDIYPAADITLAISIVSHGDHRAIALKTNRMHCPGGHLDDTSPGADVALAIIVVSHGDHHAVALKANRMVCPGGHLGSVAKTYGRQQ